MQNERIELIKSGINDSFATQNITGAYNITYSNFNVVLGANGSGKTRFLNAIRDYYTKSEDKFVLYFNFSKIEKNQVSDDGDYQDSDINIIDMLNAFFTEKDYNMNGFFEGIPCLNDKIIDIFYELFDFRRTEKDLWNFLMDALSPLERKANVSKNGWGFESRKHVKADIEHEETSLKREPTTMPIDDALPRMSDGERVLFYIAFALLLIEKAKKHFIPQNNKTESKKIVLILDEMDGRLHTRAFIEALKLLAKTANASDTLHSCWLSTHTLFALPQYDYEDIVYLHNSNVQKRDKSLYNRIFEDLVGKDESVAQMHYGFNTWQYFRYIAECCIPPSCATARQDDPQYLEFREHFNSNVTKNDKFSVLDYGGGEGRMWSIIEISKSGEFPLVDLDKLDYCVYDKYENQPTDKIGKYRHVMNLASMIEENEKFDCVLMMNVLHEISIVEWLSTFHWISHLLKDDGHLILGEATVLTRGEQPYSEEGFLLLKKEQMKMLFKLGSRLKTKASSNSIAYAIPKSTITSLTWENIHDVIESLKNAEYQGLKKQYNDNIARANDYKKTNPNSAFKVSTAVPFSRKYAFVSQHYQNACFALDKLYEYFGAEEFEQVISKSNISVDDLLRGNGCNDKLSEMINLFPNSGTLYLTRGRTQLKSCNANDDKDDALCDAIFALRNALTCNLKNLSDYYILIGDCYKADNNMQKAREYYIKIPVNDRPPQITAFLMENPDVE